MLSLPLISLFSVRQEEVEAREWEREKEEEGARNWDGDLSGKNWARASGSEREDVSESGEEKRSENEREREKQSESGVVDGCGGDWEDEKEWK